MVGVNTNINYPQSPFLDQFTGRPAREWQVWLQYPRVIGMTLANPLGVVSGGTGLSQIPTNGQLLIGNGTGYALNTLTPGDYIGVVNGPGEITVNWENLLPPTLPPPVSRASVQPSSIVVGASPFTYTNQTGGTVDVMISGGGISKLLFSRNGSTFYNTGSYYGMFTLSPWDQLQVTYVTAPTMTLIPR